MHTGVIHLRYEDIFKLIIFSNNFCIFGKFQLFLITAYLPVSSGELT